MTFTLIASVVFPVDGVETKGTKPMPTVDRPDAQQISLGGHANNHPFKVTVRTLAGHHMIETVKPDDTVAELTAKAVNHFVAKGEPVAGDYALTLPRTGGDAELDPTAALRDTGVVEGDVLVLVSRKPQVDGAAARTRWGERVHGLHRESSDLLMTLRRPDGTWTLRLGGSRYDAELFEVALINEAGAVLPLKQWIPGFAHGIHSSLQISWVCVSGTRAFYAHESHCAERWDAVRCVHRADSLLGHLLTKAGL